MKKLLLLVLTLLVFHCTKGKAQDSLVINPFTVLVGNDTLPAGSNDSIKFTVINIASTPFNDSITFYTSVQDSVSTFIYNPIDTVYLGTINIAPNDSMQFTLYNIYDTGPLRFHYDINVIVIWPIAASLSFYDSLFYNQFITLPIGINEIDLSLLINAYPNPTTSNLNIDNATKFAVEEVRIYDSRGRLMETLQHPDFICSENWSKGTYLIRIQLENKKTQTIRVVKQ